MCPTRRSKAAAMASWTASEGRQETVRVSSSVCTVTVKALRLETRSTSRSRAACIGSFLVKPVWKVERFEPQASHSETPAASEGPKCSVGLLEPF